MPTSILIEWSRFLLQEYWRSVVFGLSASAYEGHGWLTTLFPFLSCFPSFRPRAAPITATQIPDILSHHAPETLRGIINIAGIPSKSSIFPKGDSVGTGLPYSLGILPKLIAPPSVEVYREAVFALLEGFSAHYTFADRQAAIGSILCTPPSSIATMMARTQDETALRTYGTKLDQLVIYGKKDRVVNVPEVVRLLQKDIKWERLTVVVMEGNVDHIPWYVDPEQFKKKVVSWIQTVLDKEEHEK